MTNNLFDPNLPPQVDPNKNYLEELVGENKKFKTPEEMARGKVESDNYIKTLEMKLDQLREDYTKVSEESKTAASLKEILDQMKSEQQLNQGNPPIAPEVKQPTLDIAEQRTLIRNEVLGLEAQRRADENFKIVTSKLQEKFGVNYQAALKKQVDELGLDIEDVNALAVKSPRAFFKTVGLDEPEQRENNLFQAPPQSQQRSDNFSPNASIRDWAYYEKMRKDNPTLYHNPKTQVQMHKDASAIDDKYGLGRFMRQA